MRLLSFETYSLNDVLSRENLKNDKKGIGFSESSSSVKGKSIVFVQATQGTNQNHIPEVTEAKAITLK